MEASVSDTGGQTCRGSVPWYMAQLVLAMPAKWPSEKIRKQWP